MDGAGTALGDATAIFGAGQAQLFAQDPQQGRVVLGDELSHLPIHIQLRHQRAPVSDKLHASAPMADGLNLPNGCGV